MSYDLNLTNPTYAPFGNFGQGLNGGYGRAVGVLPGGTFTIRARVKIGASSGQLCVAGQGDAFFLGLNSSGKVVAEYGKPIVSLATALSINDSLEHELELNVGPFGGLLFLDGALVAQSTTVGAINTAASSAGMGVRTFAFAAGSTAYTWPGEVGEVAVFSTQQHSEAYTPTGLPVDSGAPNLRALWRLNGDGVDSAGIITPATAILIGGPNAGETGAASGNFTVSANGAITGTVVVTPSAGAGGGTFAPMSVSISAASPTAVFKYTPESDGAKSISVTNNGGLGNPAVVTYAASSGGATALTLSGPSTGVRNAASSDFTVAANGALTANRTVTPSDGGAGGTFTPAAIVLTPAATSGVFTYKPASLGAKSISISNDGTLINPAALPYASTLSPTNSLNTANAVFSPGNWKLTTNSATSINPSAYMRAKFTGKSCALALDMAGINPVPLLEYRIDTGPWTTIPFAASLDLVMPADTLTSWAEHTLELIFRANDVNSDRWTNKSGALKLTGIYLDTGAALSTVPALPLKGLIFGDSITEGCLTVNRTNANGAYWNHARFGYALELGRLLNAEVGVVGFGSTGWNKAAQGVPAFTDSYGFIYAGEARSFTGYDFIAINLGTNDGGDVSASATAVLNGLVSATPSTTKIFVLRPFNGAQSGSLQTAVNAANAAAGSARCRYINTTGFYDNTKTANYPADTVHPNGAEMTMHIAPALANALRPLLGGTTAEAPVLTQRTVSITLGVSDTTAASNLTGAMVAFYDEPTPDLFTSARFQTAAETCDANGVLTFTCGSTLPAGGKGGFVVQFPDGKHFNGQVTVS